MIHVCIVHHVMSLARERIFQGFGISGAVLCFGRFGVLGPRSLVGPVRAPLVIWSLIFNPIQFSSVPDQNR